MKVVTNIPYKVLPIELPSPVDGNDVTVIVKGTFALVHGKPLAPVPADKQRGMSNDKAFKDDIGRSLNVATDLVATKPRGEVTLTAYARSPGDVPVTRLDVGIAVGPVRKVLRVFGDRAWEPDAVTTLRLQGPLPFTSMPLRWERAFGGLASRANPMGRGLDLIDMPDGRKIFFLPNIEHPAVPVVTPKDRPAPAGFAPIPPSWEPRRSRSGTHDVRWATFRAPLPPLDMDPRHSNAAPDDQCIDGFWNGDEPVRLFNLDADIPNFATSLPGRRIRAFVHRARSLTESWIGNSEEFLEVSMRCDTVHIDTTERVALLTWRGPYPALEPKAKEVIALYIAEEPLDTAPGGLQAHYDDYVAATAPPPAKSPPPPPPPKEPMPEPKEVTAALAAMRKKLDDAKIDPALLSKLDAETAPEAKLAVTFEILQAKLGEMQQVVSKSRPPQA